MHIDRRGRVSPEERLGFRFEMALLYAFRLHAGQRRKGSNVPYIGHLLGVASLVIEAGGSEDEAIAALLHDAVEDQGGEPTRQAIASLFGGHVAEIVSHCTDADPLSPERTAQNWKVRKERYLKALRDAPLEVLRVSLSDKLYNARTILFDLRVHGDTVWSRFKSSDDYPARDRQLWYYRSLVEAFRAAGNVDQRLAPLVGELDLVVSDIEQLASAPDPG
jgi:(p)ppGpp synthase/HD superfamily hydrolase